MRCCAGFPATRRLIWPGRLAATTDAPDWFSNRLRSAYGAERTARILAAHRLESPTDFSVKGDPERWADALGGVVLPTGSVRCARLAGPVPELPGYAEGAWWVQDAAAALPARLFGDVKGLRVADLCAAPGGKTAQLAAAGALVTAVDSSRSRLARLQTNLARLRLDASIIRADILEWRPAEPFRRHSAGRAVFVDRYGSPPSRRVLDQNAG